MVGCSAGFVNVLKIKGSHNALKSGVIAANAIQTQLKQTGMESGMKLKMYQDMMEDSEIYQELSKAKSFKGAFKYGLWPGLINGFLTSWLGNLWPLKFTNKIKDWQKTQKAES